MFLIIVYFVIIMVLTTVVIIGISLWKDLRHDRNNKRLISTHPNFVLKK